MSSVLGLAGSSIVSRVTLAGLVAIFLGAGAACGDSQDPSGGDASGLDTAPVDTADGAAADMGGADQVLADAGVLADAAASPCVIPSSTTRLMSLRVDTPPVVDGLQTDLAWRCAPVLQVTLDAFSVYTPENAPRAPAYGGVAKTKIAVRSLYTATDVYFIATWADPTHSLARLPWEKQADGTWRQLSNKDSSGHDNTYYEDKFAVQWNIKSPSFAAVGCVASCHSNTSNAMPGKKYNMPGELTDLWHWKSVRTEPNRQIDDGYVADPGSGKCAGLNCRLSDGKTAGGYTDNNSAGFPTACPASPGMGMLPCFMGPAGAEIVKDDRYWILDAEKQPFVDRFKPGDRVAGMVTSAFAGGRGEVESRARYADGAWTIEIRRALITPAGEAEDVQFSDLTKAYEFGVAVFDNSQINHASHETVLKLTFSP